MPRTAVLYWGETFSDALYVRTKYPLDNTVGLYTSAMSTEIAKQPNAQKYRYGTPNNKKGNADPGWISHLRMDAFYTNFSITDGSRISYFPESFSLAFFLVLVFRVEAI